MSHEPLDPPEPHGDAGLPPRPTWREILDRPHEVLGGLSPAVGLPLFGISALVSPDEPATYRALGAGALQTGGLVICSFWLYRHPAALAGPRCRSSTARRFAAGSLRHAWTVALPLLTAVYWVIDRT